MAVQSPVAVHLTEADRNRIQAAVAQAESGTSGEIVACVMPSSDSYGIGYLRAAILFALLGTVAAAFVVRSYTGWGLVWLFSPLGFASFMMACGVLGAVTTLLWPAFRRWMVGAARLKRMVRLQAYRAFVSEEVFRTRERTGILIFVSIFEHRVEVLADEGISSVVEAGAWNGVVDGLVRELRAGRFADGFVHAVAACGNILQNAGVVRAPDDNDELSNDLRVRDRHKR